MKKVINIIILTVFGGILFIILDIVFKHFGLNRLGLLPLFLVCLFVSVTYKYLWSFQTFKTKRGAARFFSVISLSFLFLLYINSIVYRAYNLYTWAIYEINKCESRFYQGDDILRWKLIPNAKGFQNFPDGHKIPWAFDRNGFRIPLSDTSKVKESNKIDLLFLGCSFTYGIFCLAEETFPYIVAKKTNLSYINAGVPSYSLGQMLILAKKLIPKYKPKYVIVQYSPWLAARAISWVDITMPVYFGFRPTPYFSKKNGSFILELPIHRNYPFDIDYESIKPLYQGKFYKFFFEKGFRFYFYEDWVYLKCKFLNITGCCPSPSNDLKGVEKYAYNKIKTIADKNGATTIILNLGGMEHCIGGTEYTKNACSLYREHNIDISIFNTDSNIYFAQADSLLYEYLKNSKTGNYADEFHHWIYNGKDTIDFDIHPNSKAHFIIANSIINVLKKIKKD